jgi:hypothetical protein
LGRLELRYNPRRRHFHAKAAVALPEPWGHPPSSIARWVPVEMVVDTGAFRSAISGDTARALGVPVEGLATSAVLGATGQAQIPTLPWLYLQIGDLEGATLHLQGVSVLGHGPEHPIVGLNLLGVDVLDALSARLCIDLASREGRLDWA